MYKPLPKNLTLGESEIHDIGLFAREDIKRVHELGISHIQVGVDLYRTPLGGFINHSDTPNCIKTSSLKTTKIVDAEAPIFARFCDNIVQNPLGSKEILLIFSENKSKTGKLPKKKKEIKKEKQSTKK